MRRFTWMLIAAIGFAGCSKEADLAGKLDEAETLLRHQGGSAWHRGIALGLYRDVLEGTPNEGQRLRAQFGVGMIGVLDLIQAVPRLVDGLASGGSAEGEDTALPPAKDLAPVIDTLLHELLETGIVEPWRAVIAADDFSFTFGPDPADAAAPGLVLNLAGGTTLDLNGEWDLTEIRLIYGVIQGALAVVELAYAWNGVVETALSVTLGEGEIPPLPASPAEIPGWVVDAVEARGVAIPWLDPEFGVLADPAALTSTRARLSEGLGALVEGLNYLRAEEDSQRDDLLEAATFAEDLLGLVGVDLGALAVAANILSVDKIADLLSRLKDSLDDSSATFVPPPFIVDLLGLIGEGGIALTAYNGPKDPVGLRIPGLRLHKLFDDPILDLKAPSAGLLPAFDPAGRFIVDSEQEPCASGSLLACSAFSDEGVDGLVDADLDGIPDDPGGGRPGVGNGIWNDPLSLRAGDTLPPLLHTAPDGTTEPSNGIVDPVYLFFANADFNGFLAPLTDAIGAEAVSVATGVYTNPDLMRLLSAVVWIVEVAGDE